MAAELKRLRRENEILRQEREILKEGYDFFAKEGKSMRFRLIDAAKKDFPVQRLCKVLDVSASGYVAWKERPACRRQRDDMVLLALYPLGLHPFQRDLRQPAHGARTAPQWRAYHRSQTSSSSPG